MRNVNQASGNSQPCTSGILANRTSQRLAILQLLREWGSSGVLNTELNKTAYRFSARIYELRKQGFRITTHREIDGVFRFVLVSEPRRPS